MTDLTQRLPVVHEQEKSEIDLQVPEEQTTVHAGILFLQLGVSRAHQALLQATDPSQSLPDIYSGLSDASMWMNKAADLPVVCHKTLQIRITSFFNIWVFVRKISETCPVLAGMFPESQALSSLKAELEEYPAVEVDPIIRSVLTL